VNFQGTEAANGPFDARRLDPYGNAVEDAMNMAVFTPQSLTDWSPSTAIGDNQRFIQVRLTFVNNVQSGVGPEITALALPYDF
jgi:hypothetical protein